MKAHSCCTLACVVLALVACQDNALSNASISEVPTASPKPEDNVNSGMQEDELPSDQPADFIAPDEAEEPSEQPVYEDRPIDEPDPMPDPEDDALRDLTTGSPYEGSAEPGVLCASKVCTEGAGCCHPVAGVGCTDELSHCWATNYCDGAEDCEEGSVCCAFQDRAYRATACVVGDRCQENQAPVCRGDSDCGAAQFCCQLSTNFNRTSFGECSDEPCSPCLFEQYGTCSGMDLQRSDLRGAGMSSMNLSFSDFSDSDMEGAGISSCDMRGAVLDRVYAQGMRIMGGQWAGASMVGIDLSMGQFLALDLSDIDFTDANLKDITVTRSISFARSNLKNADLSGMRILLIGDDTIDFSGTIFENTVCPDETNSDNNGSTCEGHMLTQ